MDINKLIKYWVGECSGREKEKIESWINENPKYRHTIDRLQKIWKRKVSQTDDHRFNTHTAWKKLNNELDRLEKQKQIRFIHGTGQGKTGSSRRFVRSDSGINRIMKVAAILLMAGFAYLIYFNVTDEAGKPAMNELITEGGERNEMHLSDGSFIKLNVESRLTYPGDFKQEIREVHLEGEAYFNVASDERPFYVHTEGALIKVLGTEFNVKSYKDEDRVNVVVASGKVAVRPAAAAETDQALLHPGDLAQIDRNGRGEMVIDRDVDLMFHLGWLDNRIHFRDTPLQDVTRRLGRIYKVDIQFADSGLSEIPLSAEFEDESISEILLAMKHVLNLEYEVENRTVTFYRE